MALFGYRPHCTPVPALISYHIFGHGRICSVIPKVVIVMKEGMPDLGLHITINNIGKNKVD